MRAYDKELSVPPLTLMSVFNGIHDPDSLHGVDQSGSLSLQALAYAHKGTYCYCTAHCTVYCTGYCTVYCTAYCTVYCTVYCSVWCNVV